MIRQLVATIGSVISVSMLVTMSIPLTGFAQGNTDFVAMKQKINPVMQPKQPTDAIQDCARDKVCASIADVAATNLGLPPGTVTAAAAAISGGPKTKGSEESAYNIKL